MAIQKMSPRCEQTRPEVGQVEVQVRQRQWRLHHSPSCLHLSHLPSWRQHRDLSDEQAMVRGVSTWSKEHRFDVGGMEDSNDCILGPHPPAAHIPIGARQALCVQQTFL